MLLGALIVGAFTAYWLGLRPGAWAAVLALGLLLVAVLVPPLALPIHVLLAVAVVVVCLVGARRQRPPDAVRATRWVRATIKRVALVMRARSLDGSAKRKRNGDGRDSR
jgi:membrane protein implicated in regulation of membrane protease activity